MNTLRNCILFVFLAALSGCGCYSFTGATISPELKTISVQYFPNRALIVNPTFSQTFTEALKDKIRSQTSLKLVNGMGDCNFEGEVKDYSTSPVAITGSNQAAKNRLTVTIHVKFTNSKDSKLDYDTSFTRYEDYDSSLSLDQAEKSILTDIIDQLTEDIFNKAFVNW
ncbi:MAG: LptE family protein [Bacteroidota bacterium]|nr:LptE family protein [Bacteroidota bacterium]MDP4225339.1 LptE family protein [Bacteroidota bacterium]MDP4272874.1 LptE family protein [Bacteroidota bacterium]